MNDDLFYKALAITLISSCLTFFECYTSRRTNVFKHLQNDIVSIDGDTYSSRTNDEFIYYQTDSMEYPQISDKLFNVFDECGLLERNVQYCNWVEVQHSRTERQGNRTYTTYYYTYHKQWLPYQRSSLFYHDFTYYNPTVQTIPETSLRANKLKAGAYYIDPNMSISGDREYLIPNETQLFAFEDSIQFGDFKYAGKGIFYSAHERSTLEKFLRIKQFFDLKSDLIDWCTPGDRRVWFETWKPKTTTVVGEQNHEIIKPFTFDKYKIGSIKSGNVPLRDILMVNTSSFPTVMKWIFRISLILYFVYTIMRHQPDFITEIALIVVVIIANRLPLTINTGVISNILLSLAVGGLTFILQVNMDKYQRKNNHYY